MSQGPGALDLLHRKAFHAMGCEMLALVAFPGDEPDILARVPQWFEEWEQALSRFRLSSELSQLNRRPDQYVRVSETLWEVYQAALWAEGFTDGLVTPALGQALIEAGYDRSFELMDRHQPGQIAATRLDLPTLQATAMNTLERSLCLPAGIQLDLGGVAKGWAAHQAMSRLKGAGPALVDAGGDIAISGALPGSQPWPVGVANPFQPDHELALLHLGNCGVATSGRDRRHWFRGGELQHHVIDPRTGRPARTDLVAVTIVAPTVMEAEAAAKAALIMGSEAGLAWLEASAPKLAGLFVREDCNVLISQAMPAYL